MDRSNIQSRVKLATFKKGKGRFFLVQESEKSASYNVIFIISYHFYSIIAFMDRSSIYLVVVVVG